MKEEQKKALQSLERAFKKCQKAGIRFAGMDGSLYYATVDSINNRDKSEDYGGYPEVAEMQSRITEDAGFVNTHGTYEDSGGF